MTFTRDGNRITLEMTQRQFTGLRAIVNWARHGNATLVLFEWLAFVNDPDTEPSVRPAAEIAAQFGLKPPSERSQEESIVQETGIPEEVE